MRKAIFAVAIAVAALLTLGTAGSASAQTAPTVTVSGSTTSETTYVTVTYGGCSELEYLNLAPNADHYQRVLAEIDSVPCETGGALWQVEAAATCSGKLGSLNVWGAAVTQDTGTSYAPCDGTYRDFDHGGFRYKIAGTWYYDTYVSF